MISQQRSQNFEETFGGTRAFIFPGGPTTTTNEPPKASVPSIHPPKSSSRPVHPEIRPESSGKTHSKQNFPQRRLPKLVEVQQSWNSDPDQSHIQESFEEFIPEPPAPSIPRLPTPTLDELGGEVDPYMMFGPLPDVGGFCLDPPKEEPSLSWNESELSKTFPFHVFSARGTEDTMHYSNFDQIDKDYGWDNSAKLRIPALNKRHNITPSKLQRYSCCEHCQLEVGVKNWKK